MNIQSIITGSFAVNTYLLYDGDGGQAVIIDPGDNAPKLLKRLSERSLTLTHILLTHGHFDHIGAVGPLKEATGAKVAISREDAHCLKDNDACLATYAGLYYEPVQADVLLSDGDVIEALGERFRVMETPGHSRGSVCYLTKDVIFSGDTVFLESVGRSDFPESDVRELDRSLKKIAALEGDYDIYPGHGPSTTLGHEKLYNYLLSKFV